MKKTLLSFFVCLTFCQLQAQVRKAPLPLEQKVEAKAEDHSLSVFPNPSNGILNISFEGFEGKKTDLQILNVIGNVVYRETVADPTIRYVKTIDLNRLAKGVYYVKLEANDYSQVRKVILR